ncbi:MAG TPA: PqqD family protein [Burkholderiales bacterium]|nr:PqqD family protein [Burkholderiales bacterium]
MKLDRLPAARKDRLITRRLASELIIYDVARDKSHSLKDTAARVWSYCDGCRSAAEITALVSRDLRAKIDELTIWRALARLQKAHLLEQPVVAPDTLRDAAYRLGS